MQERYLGDSHDFIKYALIRHISNFTGLKVGLNWYLTTPENVDKADNSDGEKRHHMRGGEWSLIDNELIKLLEAYQEPKDRQLSRFMKSDILPSDTEYFTDELLQDNRDEWYRRSMLNLQKSDVLFLDPDNGLEVKSMTKKTKPKYALYEEVRKYVDAGKSVICIQFARQCDPIKRAKEIASKIEFETGYGVELPILRGRVAPNILLITLAAPNHSSRLGAGLKSFVELSDKVEFV
jgi:hypothetical protein